MIHESLFISGVLNISMCGEAVEVGMCVGQLVVWMFGSGY